MSPSEPSDDDRSWIQYLPAAFHPGHLEAGGRDTLDLLQVFQALLEGRADAPGVSHDVETEGAHRSHTHDALVTQVEHIPELFDPWKTPAGHLPWLAGWLDLTFPSLQGTVLWDEYQQRKVTAEIAGSYRLSGLRAGLNRALQLYAVGRIRPRIAIDDGSKVLKVVPQDDRTAPVTTLVSDGPSIDPSNGQLLSDGLFRPTCIALGPDRRLLVGDSPPSASGSQHRVWLLDAAGGYEHLVSGSGPRPVASGTNGLASAVPIVGIAYSGPEEPRGEKLFVLNEDGRLFEVDGLGPDARAKAVTTDPTGSATKGVAVVLDANGDLLILRRGKSESVKTEVQVVPADGSAQKRHPLDRVIKPLSMVLAPDGSLMVGDGGPQEPSGPDQRCGNVVRITRQNPQSWNQEVLLSTSVDDNPLVAPTGIACTADGSQLYVVDAGLKPFEPDRGKPFVSVVGEPASVFRVDLAPPRTVIRVSDVGGLVYPRGMVRQGHRLLVVDHGYPVADDESGARATPFRFEVVVHFLASELEGLTVDEDRAVRRRINGNVLAIVDQQKPAHTSRVGRTGQ